MIKRNQSGAINVLLLPLIFAVLLFIVVLVLAVWAYQGRQDYKDNVDAKISVAVKAANQKEDTVKEAEFAEREKSPLKTYTGPSAYGSVVVKYPKTWSGYVDTGNNDPFVDGYFQPDVVPSITSDASVFALRVQVVGDSYSDVLADYQSNVEDGTATVTPYTPAKVTSIVGSRIDGQLTDKVAGSMVILPIRDKTLKIWTESDSFKADFDNFILPNFTFAP